MDLEFIQYLLANEHRLEAGVNEIWLTVFHECGHDRQETEDMVERLTSDKVELSIFAQTLARYKPEPFYDYEHVNRRYENMCYLLGGIISGLLVSFIF